MPVYHGDRRGTDLANKDLIERSWRLQKTVYTTAQGPYWRCPEMIFPALRLIVMDKSH